MVDRRLSIQIALLAILIMVTCLGGVSTTYSLLISVAYLLSAASVLIKKHIVIPTFVFYLVYLALTIIVGAPDHVFKPWQRLAQFSLLFIFASPIIQSNFSRAFRKEIYRDCLILCVILSAISFFCYFLNINLFIDKYEGGYLSDYSEIAGHFAGITRHSMVLGPLSGLASLFLLHEALLGKKKIVWILLFICLGALFFSASRGAIIATSFAFIVFFILMMKQRVNVSKYIIGLFVLTIVAFPVYGPYIDASFNKHSNVSVGRYNSRSGKVEARLAEFASNPVFGVGFAAIDPNGLDVYNAETGSIEPGSSWLAILSMTGLIGIMFFLIIFINAFTTVRKSHDYRMLSFLSFFAVHMLVEGYVFSGGNAITCLLWLTMGVCYDMIYDDSSVVIN